MKVKTIIIVMLLLAGLKTVQAEVEFHLLWQAPGNVTGMDVSDLNEDGLQEILLATGYSYEKMINTPIGPSTALICEGLVSQFEPDGGLVWEKKLCKNDAASDPCYSNGCISYVYADTICTTTRKLIFVGCCYCGNSSVVRVYDTSGELLYELYDDDGAGNPIPFSGCIRAILADDIDADNCKEVIVATNLELFLYDTDCITCTIPPLPTYRTIDLPLANRPSGTIFDIIVVNFDDEALPTKEIVVAADEVTVYEHNLQLKWKYEIDTSRPVRALYAFDLDSDTAAHEIDQDPDLEPELIVGESWYVYVLDNMEQGNTNPADDQPDLKWEYSTSPYDVTAVYADKFSTPRSIMAGAATLVYVLDYNGSLLKNFNVSTEVRKLDAGDFDKNGQKELVVFSNNSISVFSTEGVLWTSSNFQGFYLIGEVLDVGLDGYPEMVGAYTLGLYVIGVKEVKLQKDSEADQLFNKAKELKDKGSLIEAMVYFEQARIKYEEAGNTFMAIQCQKLILECEKFMDTDRIVAAAVEELRNYDYEEAGYLFGQAADLYARVGNKNKMTQMRVLKETSEKLSEGYTTLLEAHALLIEEEWSKAGAEAVWARRSFEDVSSVFLTMSIESLYETLELEISAKIRECDEVKELSDKFIEAEALMEEANQNAADAERFFMNQQYSEARYAHEQTRDSYVKAAQVFDEIQIALGKRADGFRRDIADIEGKIKTLEESELYQTYGDVQTTQTIVTLQEKKTAYGELIDEYEELAESMEKKANECREKATRASNKAAESYSTWDRFLEYGKDALQPPASLAVGLACLIVVLIGVAAGKGRYVALGFLVLILIFLGVSALHFWGI